MDKQTIAQQLLEWREFQAKADALKEQITSAVLELGETVQAGDVRATYNKGRTTYDYKLAVEEIPAAMQLLEGTFLTVENLKDSVWTTVFNAMKDGGFVDEAPVKSVGNPTVTLKVGK
jgi:hypothetical protein